MVTFFIDLVFSSRRCAKNGKLKQTTVKLYASVLVIFFEVTILSLVACIWFAFI